MRGSPLVFTSWSSRKHAVNGCFRPWKNISRSPQEKYRKWTHTVFPSHILMNLTGRFCHGRYLSGHMAYAMCKLYSLMIMQTDQNCKKKPKNEHMQINSTHLEQQTGRRQRHLLCDQTLTTYIQKPVCEKTWQQSDSLMELVCHNMSYI